MNVLLYLVIHTSNVLGSFNDPFEFEGDYGPEVNPVRQKVFELVVSKEALSKNLSDSQIRQLKEKEDVTENVNEAEIKSYRATLLTQAIEEDRSHGPLFSELVTSDLINDLVEKQQELQNAGFNKDDLQDIFVFMNHYADKKAFHLLRNAPSELLSLDKTLRDKASREGKSFNLPVLSSTQVLHGHDSEELKKELLHRLFTEENLRLAKSKDVLLKSISQLDENFLEPFLGKDSMNQDLHVFCTPAGQLFYYWLYQSLNLQLIAEDQTMIDQINKVKEVFAQTIGDSQVRADTFREKLMASDSGVVFTQESDAFVPQALAKEGLFLPVDRQNPQDGTFIFLRNDLWESHYDVISLENYEGYAKGRLNLVLATRKGTGEKFLLASCHGNSTRPEDGRLQIGLVMEKFEELLQKPENKGMQLLIGIDANTKTDEDVRALREHLDALGLMGTSVGPTTIKKRMVTVQHAKAGRFAVDEEDYLVTLKPENGGRFLLTQPTVGFSEEKPDVSVALPNVTNLSDHYPVGVTLVEWD